MDNRINMEDESKILIENRKCIFCQTSINDWRLKMRVWINNIVIEGLLDIGTDMTIIILESWHPNWPVQVADVQFLEIGTLCQVK